MPLAIIPPSTKSIFSDLKKYIKNGDTKKAEHIADFLGNHLLEINERYGNLESRIVKDKSKGRRRKRAN